MTDEEMIKALADVRDQLVRDQVRPALTVAENPERVTEKPKDMRKVAQSQALYALLINLDGWIESAHENHEANGHRGENRGDECWRKFEAADFRTMINDVARELGVSEFPRSNVEKEDEYR